MSRANLFLSPLVKSEPIWLHPEELRFEDKKYYFCFSNNRTTNEAVGYKGSGQSLKVSVCGLDDVSSLLGDHDDGSVSVAGGDGWHDGGVHHS